jgi:phospholipase C
MWLWGAIPILATVAGALTVSSAARAESLADKIVAETKQEIKDEQKDRDDGEHVRDYRHIVIIYQENHSFDNLYGFWGNVGDDSMDGQSKADAAHTSQVRQDNQTAYRCLLQNDVNLISPSHELHR